MWVLETATACFILCSACLAQTLSANFTAPSLKVRPGSELMFPHKGDDIILRAHNSIPLGCESVQLLSDGRHATIMASAEVPQLRDITVFQHNKRRYVVQPNGEQVHHLPSHITFRVTASTLVELREKPFTVESRDSTLDFLRKLTFVARVFHRGEMHSESVKPESLRQIGVPPEIPAKERIYRASFEVGELSVDDHVVLEVNDAEGSPVTKFFLQLK